MSLASVSIYFRSQISTHLGKTFFSSKSANRLLFKSATWPKYLNIFVSDEWTWRFIILHGPSSRIFLDFPSRKEKKMMKLLYLKKAIKKMIKCKPTMMKILSIFFTPFTQALDITHSILCLACIPLFVSNHIYVHPHSTNKKES